MILLLIVACLLLAAIGLLLYSRNSCVGTPDDVAAQLRSLNVDAFLNLIDVREKNFLWAHLSPRTFRAVHRERMLAALQYAWHASKNARLLMQLSERARRDCDSEIALTAEKLYSEALNLRICTLQMLPHLLLSAAIPGRIDLPQSFASTYDAISCRFRTLARLQLAAEFPRAA